MDVAPSVPHRAMECVQSLIRLILLKPSSKQKHHIVGSKKVTDGTKRNKDREKSETRPNRKRANHMVNERGREMARGTNCEGRWGVSRAATGWNSWIIINVDYAADFIWSQMLMNGLAIGLYYHANCRSCARKVTHNDSIAWLFIKVLCLKIKSTCGARASSA